MTVRGLARHAIELFVSFSTRTIALAAMLCLLAAVAAVGGAVAAAIPGGLPVTGVLLGLAAASGLIALAVIARYLVHVGRGQPQTPQFLIRETNLVVRSTDLLAALPTQAAAV